MKRIFIIAGVAFLFISAPNAHGQSIGPATINATGGFGTIAGNDYEWSVGEMTMVSTFTTSAVIVTQGILQPSPTALDVKTTNSITDGLQVFPNPSSAIVNIRYTSPGAGTITYRLMDVAGRIISSNDATLKTGVNTEELNISTLADGTYMLEVSCTVNNVSGQIMTYKIQKLN